MTRRRTQALGCDLCGWAWAWAWIGPLLLPHAWNAAAFLPTAGLTFTAKPRARAPVTQYSFLGEVSTFCL